MTAPQSISPDIADANAIHIKLIDVIYGNSSTNMTPDACSRQAHRIANALIATGLISGAATPQEPAGWRYRRKGYGEWIVQALPVARFDGDRLEVEPVYAGDPPRAYEYAKELLVSFVNEHCDPVSGWKPNDDLMGILIQFDNALTVVRSIKAGFDPKRPDDAAQCAWQPIETAPRDGTPVDLWHKIGARMTELWWAEEDKCWSDTRSDDEFTHWMPVPAGPTLPSTEGK